MELHWCKLLAGEIVTTKDGNGFDNGNSHKNDTT